MSTNKIMTVDKFLGLHQSADGSTELKPGEAAVLENFTITDDYNLKLRPGTSVCGNPTRRMKGNIRAMHRVCLNGVNELLILYDDPELSGSCGMILWDPEADHCIYWTGDVTKLRSDKPVKVFVQGNDLYVVGGYYGFVDDAAVRSFKVYHSDDTHATIDEFVYTPLILTGCSPSGGGTELEPLNILSSYFRIEISSDGESSQFKLPSIVGYVEEVLVDGVRMTDEDGNPWGHYDDMSNVWNFPGDIPKGVNNVVLVCSYRDEYHLTEAKKKFLNMRHCEAYNGATDTRFFFYGDGTNICYYSGVPTYGDGLYIPAGNEIAVDNVTGPITAMHRHGSKLMVFKQNSTFTIDYSPVTLTDGRVIAGFYVRPAHKAVGNEMDNQVQTVNNYPRTLCGGVLYEWRNNASFYQDERYAKPISQRIANLLRGADPDGIITCDNDAEQTYYMFLNDAKGTVLLHRYQLDVWCMFTGTPFTHVGAAVSVNGKVYFGHGINLLYLDPGSAYDRYCVKDRDDNLVYREDPITARWESGYNAMGMDYRRKYSSYLWISMLPEVRSKMNVTVRTDRRDDYITKTVGTPLLSFDDVDFSNFSFLRSRAPRMKRIKLKAKKYVYYKLIFTVTHPGARATVLGYDQQIRYASDVK